MRQQFLPLLLASLFALPAMSGVTRIDSSPGSPFELSLDVDAANPVMFPQTGCVEYSNEGSADIDAPYVRLESARGTQLRFSPDDEWAESLEFMAISGEHPASRLPAGEKNRVYFEYRSIGTSVDIQFGFSTGSQKPFPWQANEPRMRPSWADDVVWGLCLSTLRANIGATWNDYLARMRSDIDHLSRLGENAYRLDDLWQLEVNEALGTDFAIQALDESVDLARPARGFGLAFARTYGTASSSRLRKGVLGQGWSDNYSAWAELLDNGGTLAFHGGGGGTYLFRKAGGEWHPESGRDKTVLLETDDEYALVFNGGLQMRMGKAIMRTTRIRDRQGNELRFSYDAEGRLVRVEHNDGQSLSFAYRDGLLESVSDDLGRESRYEYEDGMLVSHTSYDGLTTRYRYLPADHTVNSRALRQIVHPDGNTQDFAYDARGRLATVSVNGGTMVTEIRRGRLGSFTAIAPNGAETRVKIGSKGVPLEAVNALGQKVAFRYNHENLLSSVVGNTGKKSEIEYDTEGRPVAARDPLGATMRFGYDKDGRVDSVTDARGNSYRFGYDALGRGESVAFAGGPATRVEYSDRGDVTRFVNARGQSVAMTYDAVGRPLTKTWETGRKFSWTYDARGNCVRAEDSETGAVTMEYDALDRLVRIEHPGHRGFAYEYDALGRMVKKTSLDDGREQRYEFGDFGVLAKVSDGNGALLLANEYDSETGRIVRQRNGNGTETRFEHDILGRITRIGHFSPDGRSLGFFAYEYDADGRRISQTTPEGVEHYEYDAVGQVVGVAYPDGSSETFSYDAVGNRLSANGVAYETNARNQIARTIGAGGVETRYEYDDDGNMIRKTEADGAVVEYGYDIENRLVAVHSAAKDIDWSCSYDVLGNRIKVADHGKTTERLYSNEIVPSVAAEYVDGVAVSRNIAISGVLLATESKDDVRWLHADGVASVRFATSADGVVKASASYRVFGEVRVSDGEIPSAGWAGILGIESDSTGLLFMRNRAYDASLGRFIQQDPIGLSGKQINLYVYCGNNPVAYVDAIGLYNWCYFWRDVHDFTKTISNVTSVASLIISGLAWFGITITSPAWGTGLLIAATVAAVVALISNIVYMSNWGEFDGWSLTGDIIGVLLSGVALTKAVFIEMALGANAKATFDSIRGALGPIGKMLSHDQLLNIRRVLNNGNVKFWSDVYDFISNLIQLIVKTRLPQTQIQVEGQFA